MIERRGVATVVIGLVRPHLEATRAPRALWVPFPLGRPLGAPGDPAFQRRVLRSALQLLERSDGPVVLEDFPDDAPGMVDVSGWKPSVSIPSVPHAWPDSAAAWSKLLNAEINALQLSWRAARARFAKTMVGNSRLAEGDWAEYLVQFLDGEVPQSPVDGVSSALTVRYIADDLKSFYQEAAQSDGSAPSIAQLYDWFWYETVAGELLRRLRAVALQSEHKGFHTACSRFVVPAPWVERPATRA